MKKFLLLLIIAISSIQSSIGQKILYEVSGNLTAFTTLPVGDSVLFNFNKETPESQVAYAKWIINSSAVTTSPFSNLFSSVNYGDETYLYSLMEKNKEMQINAVIIDKNHNQHLTDSSITITDNIVGTFVDGTSLYVVTLASNNEALTINEIKRLKIVSQVTYKLPIAVTVDESNPMEFFTEGSQLTVFKGWSKVKFYKYCDKIYLTIDKPTLGNTWIVSIDQVTKNVVSRTLQSSTEVATFLIDSMIICESVYDDRIIITVYDLATLQEKAKKELLSTDPEFMVYFRYGRKHIIKKERSINMFKLLSESQAVLNVVKKNGDYVIQTGTYFDKQVEPTIMGPFSLSGLLANIIRNVFELAIDGPGMTRYFHYTYNPVNNNLSMKDASIKSTKEKVDEYEIAQRVHYQFKDYHDHKNGIVGTYYNATKKLASVVYFE
jgi:hypothetical protein